MKLYRSDEGQDLVESDSPWLGAHALIFRARVVESMGKLLREFGELLPLTCSEADVWIYNPASLIGALDEPASSVLRFKEGGIMMIQRYVFRADVVRNVDVFKIKNLRVEPNVCKSAIC